MRPYMLWLTRVYGRSITGYGTAFLAWPNVLDDWLRRCAEDRFRNERALRSVPRPRSCARRRAHRSGMTIGNRRLADETLAAWGRPRAAGQGER